MPNRLRPAAALAILCTAAAAFPSIAKAPAPSRPNVILILTDDQGYGDIASHGNPVIKTPQMDRLRDESVRFTNFHVSPSCAPTRAALMTGRYSDSTGVWHTINGRSILNPEETTIAQDFRAAGYRTGIFGKWHLGDNYPSRPEDRGFEEVLIHGGGGVEQTPDYFGNDYFDDTYNHNGKLEKFTGFCTDVWFQNAMRFIEQSHKEGKPFFVYLPTNAAHAPFRAPEKYLAMYRDVPGLEEPGFYGMITNIDDNLGRLRRYLAESGLDDNTILIFMTDNGTEPPGFKIFDGGMRGGKISPYEGGHRVPFFLRWKAAGLDNGRDIGELTAHIDVRPTLDDLCNVKAAKGPAIYGRSLRPLLFAKHPAWPERTIVVDSQREDKLSKWRSAAVMTDRWRLVTNGKNGVLTKAELYDIRKDPKQATDVAAQHPDVVAQLKAAYEDWWKLASARAEQYSRPVVGNNADNPARLTAHDWHGENGVPWNQRMIRQGPLLNGYWTIEVARSGRYRIELRRWPKEIDEAIDAPYRDPEYNRIEEPGVALPIVEARLKVDALDQAVKVQPGDKGAVFTLNLKSGPARLQTWFRQRDGRTLGAYYVYIKRLDR